MDALLIYSHGSGSSSNLNIKYVFNLFPKIVKQNEEIIFLN